MLAGHVTYDEFEVRSSKMDARFQHIDERFQQIDTRFQQIDVRFQHVDDRFQRLENKIDTKIDALQVILQASIKNEIENSHRYFQREIENIHRHFATKAETFAIEAGLIKWIIGAIFASVGLATSIAIGVSKLIQ